MDDEVAGKAYDGRIMRRLLTYMRPYRGTVAVALVLLLFNAALQVAGPLLIKLSIDRYLAPPKNPSPTWLDPYLSVDPWVGLAQISLLYGLAIIGVFLLEFGQTYWMQWAGQNAMLDLRRQLMQHLQRLDVSYFDRNPVGRLVTRVTTDVDVLNDLFTSGLVTIVGDLLMLSFVVLAMMQLSPGMTLLMLAVMPLVIWVTRIFRRSVAESYRRIRVAIAKINSYIQEHVNGISVLQLFNRDKKSAAEFDRINAEHMIAFKDSVFAYAWFYPVIEFLSMLALALLLAYGGYKILNDALTVGVLVAFFQYGLRFFRPIQDLSEKYNVLQAAMAASERIFKLLDTGIVIQSPAGCKAIPAGRLAIEFDHVWFAYTDQEAGPQWVLQDVSFRLEPGKTIAVVGHTGAGKTTLANLLLRFYDVQRGRILLGGVDIRDLDLLALRRQFGIVLQDPYLFTGSVGENIRLGTERISDAELEAAADKVNLREFIESLPQRFAQPVLERGAGFSTGQKQLISFARALAHDPRFLILDEATSSVDTDTEIRVREALGRLVAGRTSIVIAHRLSTIQQADRILVMHKGRLRETGTHQELLAIRGIYWKLYQLQYRDQEVAGRAGELTGARLNPAL